MTEKATTKAITKRARRKLGANPSQLWPQMPKVSSSEARSKAHLRVAGLMTTKQKEALDPKLDLNSPELKFGRLLGSPEQRIRHAAVLSLNQYLTERSRIHSDAVGLSELDLLKLWKGLWYTLYMADRVPVQEELAKKLSELLWCVAGTEEEDEYAGKAYLDMYDNESNDDDDEYEVVMQEISNTVDNDNSVSGDENENDEMDDDEDDEMDDILIPHCRGAHLAALLVKTFFQTICREWGRMDKYRVDKFYTVIRLMMGQVYAYMAKRHWNLGIVRLFNDTIYEQVLSKIPNGIRCHLIDLTLEELAKANATAPMPLTEVTFKDVLEPYMSLCQSCDDEIVQLRVVENILLKFLETYSVISEAAISEEKEEDDSLIMNQVHVGTIADLLFVMGSDTATMSCYRNSLYGAFKEYKRRLQKVGKDVVLLDQNDDDDNVENSEENDDEEEENVRTIVVDDPMNLSEKDLLVDNIMIEKNSETKKAKRKKRSRQPDDDDVPADSSNEKQEDNATTKKGKKKRKKNKKAKLSQSDTSEVETKKNSNVEVSSTKDQKKKDSSPKNQKKKVEEKDLPKESDQELETIVEESPKKPVTDQKKKSDKKKKKKNKQTASSKSDDDNDEEVINISLAQQEHAEKRAADDNEDDKEDKELSSKKKKKKKKKQKKSSEEETRRVSFGKVNHSKSHKASMRALKCGPLPKLGAVTPEKSILRSTEKSRKKASRYF